MATTGGVAADMLGIGPVVVLYCAGELCAETDGVPQIYVLFTVVYCSCGRCYGRYGCAVGGHGR